MKHHIINTGTNFSQDNIIAQYEHLLQRIASNDFKIGRMMSVIDTVLRDAHVFRDSRENTASKKLTAARKLRIQKMIEECRVKATALKTKHLAARRSTHKVDPVLGQRVLLPGDRWDLADYYAGVVEKVSSFHVTSRLPPASAPAAAPEPDTQPDCDCDLLIQA